MILIFWYFLIYFKIFKFDNIGILIFNIVIFMVLLDKMVIVFLLFLV